MAGLRRLTVVFSVYFGRSWTVFHSEIHPFILGFRVQTRALDGIQSPSKASSALLVRRLSPFQGYLKPTRLKPGAISGVARARFSRFSPIFRNSRKLSAFSLKCSFYDMEAPWRPLWPTWSTSGVVTGGPPVTPGDPSESGRKVIADSSR